MWCMSLIMGTNRTNRAGLMMSVPRGRPEVGWQSVKLALLTLSGVRQEAGKE
jgi:hypothetical protein